MAYATTVDGVRIAETIKVKYSGTDTLFDGYAVAYNHDGSTAALRNEIEKPTYGNLMAGRFAGVVSGAPPGGYRKGNQASIMVDIVAIDVWAPYVDVKVLAFENVVGPTATKPGGDILGPIPGKYTFGRGVFPGCACFRAGESVDGSTTAAMVAGRLGRLRVEDHPDSIYRFFDTFDGDKAMGLGGATAAEVLQPGYLITGATVAAAGTGDPAGRLAITPTTTTIGEIRAGGISAMTASGATLLPILLAAGVSCFFRARVNLGVSLVTNDVFCGLAITGACISDGTVPVLDDYIGFYMQGDVDGSINFATNKDNGTDNVSDTAIDATADTMHDLAFLVINRKSGTAIDNKEILVFVDGLLTNTLNTAVINALINDDEAMGLCFGGIGPSAIVVEIDRWEVCMNLNPTTVATT